MTSESDLSKAIPHDPSLSTYAIPPSKYLSKNPTLKSLAIGAFIFSRPSTGSPPKLLLLQRSSSEPSFPSLWEPPGGGVEESDVSILASLAREVFEETGLKVSKVIKEVTLPGGERNVFQRRSRGMCEKINFWVEVDGQLEAEEGKVDVKLEPKEHMMYKWCEKGEIGELELMTVAVGLLIGRAFEVWEECNGNTDP